VCEERTCDLEVCRDRTCSPGQACDPTDGRCVADPCLGTSCPDGFTCHVTCGAVAVCQADQVMPPTGTKVLATGSGGFTCAVSAAGRPSSGAGWGSLLAVAGLVTLVGRRRRRTYALMLLIAAACESSSVSSEEQARRIYLGLDLAVERALNLGMDGFNAASSANIPAQAGPGEVSGTLTITGQVDQGASANKGMRLRTAFATYSDLAVIPAGVTADAGPGGLVYDTDAAALPALDLSLRGIPDGTFTGTLTGTVIASGDLDGDVVLAVSFAGQIQSAGGGKIRRVPGTTHVTGTATSRFGTYTIDLTR
jgi:MYXO-CTERM domain-containing protein